MSRWLDWANVERERANSRKRKKRFMYGEVSRVFVFGQKREFGGLFERNNY